MSDFKHGGGGDHPYCWRNHLHRAPLPGSIQLGSPRRPTAGAVCRSRSRAAVAGSPGRKGAMGASGCLLPCLHPEQGQRKASAAGEAAFQAAGSGAGGDICGKEVSTPKRTEPENQPFSSSHPDPLCVLSVLQAPAPLRSPLFPAGERSVCSQPVEPHRPPRVSPAGARPDES